ncbi:MAG: hypothetical protein U1F35_08835 [Steroidobacteraceae bacterium]
MAPIAPPAPKPAPIVQPSLLETTPAPAVTPDANGVGAEPRNPADF